MADYLLQFSSFGAPPAPQGSKNVGRHGQVYESSPGVKPFRDTVAMFARLAISRLPRDQRERFPLDGPLVAKMVFTVKRVTNPERADAPCVYPDLSKYARAAEDAVKDIVWTDDGRVIGYDLLWKTYPKRHPDALDKPGLVMAVRRATHAELGLEPGSFQAAKYQRFLEMWGEDDGHHLGPVNGG